MRLITTTHLKTWAGSKASESRFPHIVKNLICAVIQPKKIRFPSVDAIWVPGTDGVLVNTDENRFVPTGLSVWELGTGVDYKKKAKRDYQKRSTEEPEKIEGKSAARKYDKSEITFVFVTPLVWRDKEDWVAARKNEGKWRDIRVIDGVDLQDWLEIASAVSLQFAAELGIVPEEGLYTPDQAWEEWSRRTEPPTSEELVIVGREEQEKELIDRLIDIPTTFTVRGDSQHEAWGFTLAALRKISSEEELLRLYSRTIVADNERIAGRLQHLQNLIIVLRQAFGQVSGHLSTRGCHVIIPEGNDARSERNVIVLSRTTHRPFSEAIVKMGLSENEAEQTTRACGRSVTILQRLRAHANIERPRWADENSVVNLLPALLAGRWNENNDEDCKILCKLFDTDEYSHIEGKLQEFLGVDEPPLQKIGEMWTLTAPVDAFQLTAWRLTKSNLELFKDSFREVFGRIDSKVEIPPDDWIYYDIKGTKSHSGWLRTGMAETLLLIAERGPNARLTCVRSPQAYVEEVVRGLPGLNDDWRVLASIRDQYARLLEAAPDPLLKGLERLFEAKPEDVRRLFEEGEGIFGGGGMHTGLLWGLETLAWSPEYLTQIALILAKLARIDPGGRLANRPINSLREIFLWWRPGTNAPLDVKLSTLDLILEHEAELGWDLLAELLPKGVSSIAHQTSKPRWRDFGDLPEDAYTRRGQFNYLSGIIDRALKHVGKNPERWRSILDSFGAISSEHQDNALKLLDEITKSKASVPLKTALWKILRNFIHRHRSFKDAAWAHPGDTLDQFDSILINIAPQDPVERNRWLFDEWFPDLPTFMKDHESDEKELEKLRQQAVKEIFGQEDTKGIIRLGTICEIPGFVASSIMPLMKDLSDVENLINQSISEGEAGIYLAAHISGQALNLHGQAWRDWVFKKAKEVLWPCEVTATLLICWPDERSTWDNAAALGEKVEVEYWRRKTVFNIQGTPEDQFYQIKRLIIAGRAAEAFDRVALRGKGVPTKVLLDLFDATFKELYQVKTKEEILRLGLNSYDMRRYLDELRHREDLIPEELARREYQALPILGSLGARGLTIHRFMADDPDFFVDVLCDVFLPAGRDKSKAVKPTEKEKDRANTGYTLLQSMDIIPGQGGNEGIDEEALLQWINTVRKNATEKDRATVADIKIGEILAHAPPDPNDEGWPHRSVRNIIERLSGDDIHRGLVTERFNMRGVVTKSPYEGGIQERALAAQYRGWADLSRDRWPRMTRVLESIANSYDNDAERENDRAEQHKVE